MNLHLIQISGDSVNGAACQWCRKMLSFWWVGEEKLLSANSERSSHSCLSVLLSGCGCLSPYPRLLAPAVLALDAVIPLPCDPVLSNFDQ